MTRRGFEAAAALWPEPSAGPGKYASRLGRLKAQPWPRPFALESGELGKLLHRASAVRVGVGTTEHWPAVRDPVVALNAGLDRLGVARSHSSEAGPGEVCLRPMQIDDLESHHPDTTQAIPVIVGVLRAGSMDHVLRSMSRFACVGATDPTVVRLLSSEGVAARLWAPLGVGNDGSADAASDPLIAGLPRAARGPLAQADVWCERPLDIVSLGEEGGVRAEFLGRQAGFFARHASVVIHRRRLWRLPGEAVLAEPTARFIFRRSRIVLNVQAEEFSALDWSMGVIDAMALGSLAVSTPCFPHPFLTKDVHYLEETLGRLPKLMDWLLRTPEGARTAEKVRANAMAALAAHASPARMMADLLAAALDTPSKSQ